MAVRVVNVTFDIALHVGGREGGGGGADGRSRDNQNLSDL